MACSDGVPEIRSDTTPVNRKVRRLNSGDLFHVVASSWEVKCRKTAGEVKIMCVHIIRAGGKKETRAAPMMFAKPQPCQIFLLSPTTQEFFQ